MKHVTALVALLATSCASMEPAYVRPNPSIPASWPAGDPYLRQSEATLPAVTYQQIFRDARLQSLIEQALANNRDLRIAAANIAAAQEQVRIQRAQQFPQVDGGAGATVTGSRSEGGGSNINANYNLGLSVPRWEVDLFGRLRSLTSVEFSRYLATEAGARATRLTLVANVADAWLNYAADASLLLISQQTVASAQKSVRLTRARLEGGVAPRTDLRQAEQILSAAQADVAQQRTALAQDVNLLQLLVGAPFDPKLLPASIDQAAPTIAELPAGIDSYVLLRRPDVVEAEYQLRAANAQIGAARAALFPRITLTGLLGLASTALGSLFSGGAFGFSAGADATQTIFDAGARRATVRQTEAQREAAVATYQRTVQTAFREVADALARRGTMMDEIAARQRQQAASGDNYMLSEARYRNGVDTFLSVLDSQRSYYAAQQLHVLAQRTAASNLVDLYQTLGGDSLYPVETPTTGAPTPQR
ncbi:efflux transporter outer membrane subunit [Sphingomonas sp. SM33]|uniref:Efflux transporter outer membrane subunit n=1 Tax=Sphingomonas telluris TaxID=2907998 RepID=A0ABS9VN27_9SPHN|nr:efflux transporter outer membrane subunit [Sphingomonas telluris]MCH8616113.1 efflux transporter outer membrane subunit [Sphingomonas telluris]